MYKLYLDFVNNKINYNRVVLFTSQSLLTNIYYQNYLDLVYNSVILIVTIEKKLSCSYSVGCSNAVSSSKASISLASTGTTG